MSFTKTIRFRQIVLLSLFGLAMGILSLELIRPEVEPFIWFIIFLFSAWRIGREGRKGAFIHGLLTGIANSVWIVAVQYIWYETYLENHPEFTEMFREKTFLQIRSLIPWMGFIAGLLSGIVLGGFSFVASLIFGRRNPAGKI